MGISHVVDKGGSVDAGCGVVQEMERHGRGRCGVAAGYMHTTIHVVLWMSGLKRWGASWNHHVQEMNDMNY